MKKCGAQLLKGKLPVSDLKCFHLLSSNDVITHSLTPLPSLLSLSNHVALAATLKEKKQTTQLVVISQQCHFQDLSEPHSAQITCRFSVKVTSLFFFFSNWATSPAPMVGSQSGRRGKKTKQKTKEEKCFKESGLNPSRRCWGRKPTSPGRGGVMEGS